MLAYHVLNSMLLWLRMSCCRALFCNRASTGVAEQTPCADGVVDGQEGACRGCNATHPCSYRAQNKFWHAGH